MLWIGERTRQLDGAHVEFLRGVGNPIGCKVGPTTDAGDVLELCDALNPARIPGRLTLITRMGADHVEDAPAAAAAGRHATPAIRSCGRATRCTATRSPPSHGRKTRHFDDICARSPASCAPTEPRARGRAASTSSSPATTSPSASAAPTRSSTRDLDDRYETMCDPRLNARQSLDLAFRVAELISGDRPV